MRTILLVESEKQMNVMTKMNNFLSWYSKIQNVNPITNEKFETILERMQKSNQVP